MEHPFNRDLQDALDSDEAYSHLPIGTWMEGGCALLAQALQRLIPDSHLMVVGRATENGILDHVVLQIELEGVRWYLDYDGLQSEYELLDKVATEWKLSSVELARADLEALEAAGVVWQQSALPAFARYLDRELGEIDKIRLDPSWGETLSLGCTM